MLLKYLSQALVFVWQRVRHLGGTTAQEARAGVRAVGFAWGWVGDFGCALQDGAASARVAVSVGLHRWGAARYRRVGSKIAFAVVAAVGLQAAMVITTRAALYDDEDYLVFPERWLASLDLRAPVRSDPALPVVPPAVGGMNIAPLSLVISNYRVQRGDTLSSIAFDFGIELDTVASLNRTAGVGVHMVDIGEIVRVPNQDGIYLPAGVSLEETSLSHGVLADEVLATNKTSIEEVVADSLLFFPGVQHSGAALTLAIGAAFQRPLTGGWVSSRFGPRIDPFTKARRMHNGVDVAARRGTPVRATQDGRVAAVGESPHLGNYIIISHYVERYSSVYGHLERAHVRRGQIVERGQLIGAVGSTGRSTAPHLHFELRQGQRPVNPADLIARMH